MVWSFLFQRWVIVLFTHLFSYWAATVEAAAWNRIYRLGNAAFNVWLFAAPGWIGNWHCCKQCIRVWVEGIGQDLLSVAHLDDFS